MFEDFDWKFICRVFFLKRARQKGLQNKYFQMLSLHKLSKTKLRIYTVNCSFIFFSAILLAKIDF